MDAKTPVVLLEGAEEAVDRLASTGLRLVLLTKGDLFDQETRVARAGIARDKNPSNGTSLGQMMPTVPIGSFIARVTFLNGVWCTAPSYLSARAA